MGGNTTRETTRDEGQRDQKRRENTHAPRFGIARVGTGVASGDALECTVRSSSSSSDSSSDCERRRRLGQKEGGERGSEFSCVEDSVDGVKKTYFALPLPLGDGVRSMELAALVVVVSVATLIERLYVSHRDENEDSGHR